METDHLLQKQNCYNVISLWMLSTPGKAKYYLGMIFCRYERKIKSEILGQLTVLRSYSIIFVLIFSLGRFCYVRFANGLVTEGLKLLHFLIFFMVFVFHMTGTLSWLGHAWWKETGYTDIAKGKFCNKESVSVNMY